MQFQRNQVKGTMTSSTQATQLGNLSYIHFLTNRAAFLKSWRKLQFFSITIHSAARTEQKNSVKQNAEEDEHMRHLSNLQFKLNDELDQLQKYKVNTEMDILHKVNPSYACKLELAVAELQATEPNFVRVHLQEKDIQRCKVTMAAQRKSILELQLENEKLSIRLDQAMENNDHIEQRYVIFNFEIISLYYYFVNT